MDRQEGSARVVSLVSVFFFERTFESGESEKRETTHPLLLTPFFPSLISIQPSQQKRYCRFYCGRRTDDDERQISRWNGVAGSKGRWRRALANKCASGSVTASRSSEVSPVITQTLLHWADALTDRDVDEALRRIK